MFVSAIKVRIPQIPQSGIRILGTTDKKLYEAKDIVKFKKNS